MICAEKDLPLLLLLPTDDLLALPLDLLMPELDQLVDLGDLGSAQH
jgi:hypothetical protein